MERGKKGSGGFAQGYFWWRPWQFMDWERQEECGIENGGKTSRTCLGYFGFLLGTYWDRFGVGHRMRVCSPHCLMCRRWIWGTKSSQGGNASEIMFPWTHSIALHFSCQLILTAVFSLDQYVIYFGSTKSYTTGMRLVFLPTENHLLFSRQQLLCSVSLHLPLFSVFSSIFNCMHSFLGE